MRLRPVIVVTPLLAAGLLLAGCGGISPGSAAVVDGTTISMDEADRAADVFCQTSLLSAAQQGGTVDNGQLRRGVVSELVTGVVAREVARRDSIDVPRTAWVFTDEQRDQVAQALPKADLDTVVDVLQDSQYTYAVAERIGERETGEKVTDQNAAQLQDAGRAVLAKAVTDADVRIDPRFGLGRDGQEVAQTGSLSVASADLADSAPLSLPATQRCS